MLGRRSFFGLLFAPATLPLLKLVEWVKPKGLPSAWTDERDASDLNECWGWKRENGEWTHSVQIMGVDRV